VAEPLSVVCWKWGSRFSWTHVNVLRAALAKHLRIPHRLYCVTEDTRGLDQRIARIHLPEPVNEQGYVRCRRRMRQFDPEWASAIGSRILAIDLDVVIVDDITPIVDRPEPIVGWKVGHAGVYSGSFVLFDARALAGAWLEYQRDPVGTIERARGPKSGVPSDQAMLNKYLESRAPIPFWTEADGFVTYYGEGYGALEHLGVGPGRPDLPLGARIVVLGSKDLDVISEFSSFGWIREHWGALAAECRS
jgi:hypothetical protein